MRTREANSIQTRWLEVMRAAGHMKKDGENTHFKYKFLSHEAASAVYREALIDQGLVVGATKILDKQLHIIDGTTHAMVHIQFEVHCVDSVETMVFEGVGQGQDRGDKAIMKATTAAKKSAMVMSICASSGDDPEADQATDALPIVEAILEAVSTEEELEDAKAKLRGMSSQLKSAGILGTVASMIKTKESEL